MTHRTKIALVTRAAIRSVALVVAAFTLAGQLAAASHIHNKTYPDGLNAAQLKADTGFCALCLLAFHTSAAPSAPVAASMPRERREAPPARRIENSINGLADTLFGRAPPTAL